jgi:hypothetical protein
MSDAKQPERSTPANTTSDRTLLRAIGNGDNDFARER